MELTTAKPTNTQTLADALLEAGSAEQPQIGLVIFAASVNGQFSCSYNIDRLSLLQILMTAVHQLSAELSPLTSGSPRLERGAARAVFWRTRP